MLSSHAAPAAMPSPAINKRITTRLGWRNSKAGRQRIREITRRRVAKCTSRRHPTDINNKKGQTKTQTHNLGGRVHRPMRPRRKMRSQEAKLEGGGKSSKMEVRDDKNVPVGNGTCSAITHPALTPSSRCCAANLQRAPERKLLAFSSTSRPKAPEHSAGIRERSIDAEGMIYVFWRT